MRGSKNFRQRGGGGPGPSVIEIPDNVFIVLFLVVLHLFYRMPMVYFKVNYNFPRFQRGSNIFPGGGGGGGVQLFLGGGGSNCLFPIESSITCVFLGGSGPLAPLPPLDQCMQYFAVKKVNYEKKLSILTPPPPLGIPKCIHGVWENNHSGLTRIQIVLKVLMGAQ